MSTPTGDPGQPYGSGDPQDATRQQQAGEQQYGQPQYGQPQYGQTPYPAANYGGAPAPQGAPRNGLGTASLVLGIIGLLLAITVVVFWLGGVLGLVAIIFAIVGMGRAKRGQATNRGVAIGGLVTGILALLIAVVIGVVAAVAFFGTGGGDYVSCLQQAGQDQSAAQQCAQQYGQQLERRFG